MASAGTTNLGREHRTWARRTRRLIVVGIAFGALALLTAPRAAADYSVVQCVPNAVPYTDGGVVPFGAYSIWARQRCGTEYGLGLETGADTGWTANRAGLAWRFAAPGGTRFTSTNATVHYGNDGGFAAASFSDGTPAFQVFATCGTPTTCWTTASANGGTIFEIRL